MAVVPWNVEWLNANSQRAYPLSAAATRMDLSGAYQLPNDLLVDLVLTVPEAAEDVTPGLFHVMSLSVFSTGVVITFGYNGAPAASVSVAQASHTPNRAYLLTGLGDFYDTVGIVTVGSFSGISSQPAGLWHFDADGGQLEARVIRPSLRGVGSISLSPDGPAMSGDVQLEGGNNVKISVSGQTIRIDCLAPAASLSDPCGCDTLPGSPIYSINGVSPGGPNMVLTGDDCIRISQNGNGLALENLCSKPCCGCTELAILEETAKTVQAQSEALNKVVLSLDSGLRQLMLSVTASRLNTHPPCDT